jgi:beta-RFAP synthase
VDRARRSAIGTWTFAHGGLVVEGGRRRDRDECGPLLARLPFPPDWRCVVAVPGAAAGISGETEDDAFAQLPVPSEHDVQRVAHLVLMALLPSLAEADLDAFGAALTEIQEITGRWFAAVQGSTFASGPSEELVQRMRAWGARGVGQSSWGPTVYGIVRGDEAARRLADQVGAGLGSAGAVYEGAFRAEGARVWRT